MILLDKIEATCIWPCSVRLPWWKWVDKSCKLWTTMAWMKKATRRFYLKGRWTRKSRLCCHTRTPNLNSVSCMCWCGCAEARTERITPTNTCMDYSCRASVGEYTPQTKEMQSTHAPRQRTQQKKKPLHYKQTRSLTNKHTSMSSYNAYGHEQIGTWFHRNIR